MLCAVGDFSEHEISVEKHDAKWSAPQHFSSFLTNTQVLYNCTQHSGQVFYFFYKIHVDRKPLRSFPIAVGSHKLKHVPQPIRLHVIICRLFYKLHYFSSILLTICVPWCWPSLQSLKQSKVYLINYTELCSSKHYVCSTLTLGTSHCLEGPVVDDQRNHYILGKSLLPDWSLCICSRA
jgi:hypothetical protein